MKRPVGLRVAGGALALVLGACVGGDSAPDAAASDWAIDSVPLLVIRDTVLEGEPTLLHPAGATVLSSGVIAVADQWAPAVRFFDPSGKLIRTVGRAGDGPGEFDAPSWLGQCGQDSVFVWDYMQQAMSVLDSAGSIVRESQIAGSPAVFRCARNGRFAVFSDPVNGVYSLSEMRKNPDHRLLASLWVGASGPDSTHAVGVLPVGQNRVLGKTTQVAFGNRRLFVGTADSAFVSVYDSVGRPVGSFRFDAETRRPTEQSYQRWLDNQTAPFQDSEARRQMQVVAREMFPPPATLPAYFGFAVDPHDLLWIVVSPPGDGVTRLHAVTETGAAVADLAIPTEMTVWEVGKDYVLGSAPDEDGVYGVLMYRLRRGGP